LDPGPGRADRGGPARRGAAVRLGVRRHGGGRVLVDRRRPARQQPDLRREGIHDVSHDCLQWMVSEIFRVRAGLRLRRVLPEPGVARPGRPARPARGRRLARAAVVPRRARRRRARLAAGHPPVREHRLMNVIETRELRKDFTVSVRKGWLRRERRTVPAVDGIDLTVERGELLGYIGPNGAGKSTTLKMLTGVLFPTAGHVSVCGFTPVPQRTRLARRIGVVFGQRSQLWW